RHLHSFPTRRSSDLTTGELDGAAGGAVALEEVTSAIEIQGAADNGRVAEAAEDLFCAGLGAVAAEDATIGDNDFGGAELTDEWSPIQARCNEFSHFARGFAVEVNARFVGPVGTAVSNEVRASDPRGEHSRVGRFGTGIDVPNQVRSAERAVADPELF